MAKRLMREWMRDKLRARASELVNPVAEKKALDAAYKTLAPMVMKVVTAKYPLKDMKICEKYGVAKIDDCITLQLTAGGVDRFEFIHATGPLVACANSCRNRIYLADDDTTAAFAKWVMARDVLRVETKKRLDAYYALIRACNTAEDLLELWPEAASIIPIDALPVALGPDEIKLLKADQAERSKIAA